MIPTIGLLHSTLKQVLADRKSQGHETTAAEAELAGLPDSYDALIGFAEKVPKLPKRPDYKWVHPETWADIVAEMAPNRPADPVAKIDLADAAKRVEAGFLGSICGCILGKPLEIHGTLEQIKPALQKIGEWPLNQYVSKRLESEVGIKLHPDAPITVRENIHYVAPDDDINYTVMGMMVLEAFGVNFTKNQLRSLWFRNIPAGYCWGPERMMVIRTALASLGAWGDVDPAEMDKWVQILNPGDGKCGAQIRADAYGYACPGRPMLAAELAWRDSSFTHRLTGVYSTMYTSAAIALAMVERDPMQVMEKALAYVPQRSRFAAVVRDAIAMVKSSSDFEDGYAKIHAKYGEFGHCLVYQETATLVNTMRFATSVGDGICKQVMQMNDADSYGATVGSMLGCFFGPGHLEDRWLAPFHDRILTTLANFHEQSIKAVAKRMAALPALIAGQLATGR